MRLGCLPGLLVLGLIGGGVDFVWNATHHEQQVSCTALESASNRVVDKWNRVGAESNPPPADLDALASDALHAKDQLEQLSAEQSAPPQVQDAASALAGSLTELMAAIAVNNEPAAAAAIGSYNANVSTVNGYCQSQKAP